MRTRLLLFVFLTSAVPSIIRAQWQDLSDPSLGDIIYCKFISQGYGWISTLGGAMEGLLRTTDGGESWMRILNHPPGTFNWIFGFDLLNDSVGYAVSLRGVKCFRTINGGQAWDTVGCGMNPEFEYPNIKIFSVDLAYYGGGTSFNRSVDSLRTWQVISTIPQAHLFSAARRFIYLSQDTIVACGGDPTFLGGEWTGTIECYKSTDGGLSWGFPFVDTLALTYAVSFGNNTVGYAFSDLSDSFPDPHYKTHKTTDGGSTWFQIPARLDSGYMQVTDAYFKNPNEGFVCGERLARSTDGGLTWRTIPGVTGSYMSWPDSLHGWIVGSGGTIFRTTTGGVTWIDDKSHNRPAHYTLGQNYPNPFNPNTTIEFAVPTSGFVSLKVYDLLGQEVTILVQEEKSAGQHIATWDASGIASGVYFYRLQAGSFIDTKKLILLR